MIPGKPVPDKLDRLSRNPPKHSNVSSDALIPKIEDDPESGLDPVEAPEGSYRDKKIRYLVLAIGLVILAFLGFTAFLLRPKRPEVSLVSFRFDEDSPATPDEDGELYTNWVGTVSVKSDNYVGFRVRDIDVKAYLPTNHQIPVATGLAKDILIRPRGKTVFAIPFKVPVYKPSSGRPNLLEACMATPQVSLQVDVSVDLNVLHWTGRRLNSSLRKEIDCQLPQLFGLVKDLMKDR